MSRGRLLAIAGLAAGFVVALVLVAMLGGGTDGPAPRRVVAVTTSITPNPVFFGDLVTARAEVVLDRRRIDADRARIEAEFAPYSLVGRPRESRTDSGQTTSIDARYTLQCLVGACLPQAGGIALPKLRLRSGSSTVSADWPRVVVVSRLAPAALATDPPAWRQQVALPAVSYRVQPGPLATVLTLAAAVLALCAFVLIGREVARRRRLLVDRARFRSALARAVYLARASATRSPDDRRRALALLARVLAFDPNGGRRLAPAAARLAWGRSEPSTEGLEKLVEEIERTVRVR